MPRGAHAVKEASEHVAGVAENDLHVDVLRLLLHFRQVARLPQIHTHLDALSFETFSTNTLRSILQR